RRGPGDARPRPGRVAGAPDDPGDIKPDPSTGRGRPGGCPQAGSPPSPGGPVSRSLVDMYSTGQEGLDTEVRLRLSSPADVISAVPYLLGFHPRDSLVLVSLHGRSDRRISLASRIDLPPRGLVGEAAVHLARIVVGQGCDEVLVAVVGGGAADGGSPPRADVVASVRAAFEERRVPVPVAVWASEVSTGAPWHCYDSGMRGVLPDPETSAVAAATVAAGHVTY